MSNTFSDKYVADEKNRMLLKETMWGPNAIRQAEELASHFTITKDMKILDLGTGTGLSAFYLVQEHGTIVFATDLYADPTENYERFKSLGVAEKIVPMLLDATQPLPFAKDYFDVVFSVGAYNMFGDNEEMLPKLIPYIKKGGYIAVAFPGLKYEFGNNCDNVPPEMQEFWSVPDVARCVRGIEWWRDLFNKAEGLEIINVSEMACHDIAWEEYLTSLDPNKGEEFALDAEYVDKWTLDMKKAEDGKYFNTIQLIAKVI
ncbi:MAG: class I SAM-dependent methyltransferase [Oscillospiraceae bacterium]|nr:class I SAM-dependent methyltransferase [Oscillospiraceae bacterium]